MSFQVTQAFVLQFSANIYMLAQQKGARFRPLSRSEDINGKSKAFDRIGKKTAQRRTTRHSDTPQNDTPHSRRWCYLNDYHDGDLIDDMDKIRMLNDPQSEYMMAIVWALGRSMDDEFVLAADGVAVTGADQDTTASHPNSQKLVACDGAGISQNLNILTLRKMKQLFDQAEIPPEIPRYLACTASQMSSLLSHTEVTSADYNTVRALVNGDLNTFLGFNFVHSERLANQASSLAADLTAGTVGAGAADVNGFRKVIAWAKDGMITGVGQDIKARISERADKCYSVQTYGEMSVGAVRMEEEKVVIAFCDESK